MKSHNDDVGRGETTDDSEQMLYQVAACPIAPGYGGGFALKTPSGSLFFYAPCCGVAWAEPPGETLDEILTLANFVRGNVELPTRREVVAAGFHELVEWPYRYWAEDIPTALGSRHRDDT